MIKISVETLANNRVSFTFIKRSSQMLCLFASGHAWVTPKSQEYVGQRQRPLHFKDSVRISQHSDRFSALRLL